MLILASDKPIFFYPPLPFLFYAIFILFNLPPMLLIVISIVVIAYFTYKMNNRAIPLLFISFLFIRSVVQGEYDILLMALTMLMIYFFEKKPLLSGFFAGLTALVKPTGFLIIGCYIFSILIFKRRQLFKKDFYKSKFFIGIVIMLLVLSPWYLRNYSLFKGDLIATVVGQTKQDISTGEQFLRSEFQITQPEMTFLDTTGYYPTPVDFLFSIGAIFLVYNIIKSKTFNYQQLFIIVFILVYVTCQIFEFRIFMTIRHYLIIFPLLAIEIAKNIKEKHEKYVFIICFIIFIYFISTLPKYAFNDLKAAVGQACPTIKNQVNMKPVYVDAFHNSFVGYTCDLNMSSLEDSEYVVNFTSGKIYPTIR